MEKSNLTRLEKIRSEAEKALEYHQHVVDIPLHDNFRVEISPQEPPNSLLFESSFLQGGNNHNVLAGENPFVILKSEKHLIECLKGDLELVEKNPTQEIKDRILASFQQLTNQYKSKQITKELHEKVLTSVFGSCYFKNSNEFKK